MKWRNGKAYNDDGSEMSPGQLDLLVKSSQRYVESYKQRQQEHKELSKEEILERLNNCNFNIKMS